MGFWRILLGYILTPGFKRRGQSISIILPLLQDAHFEDNLFSGLTFATFIYADAGILEFRRNTVRECMAGFFYGSLQTLAYVGDLSTTERLLKQDAERLMTRPLQALGQDPYFLLGSAIARSIPLPDVFDGPLTVDLSGQLTNSEDSFFVLLEESFSRMLNAISKTTIDTAPTASTQVKETGLSEAGPVQSEMVQPVQAAISPATITAASELHQNLLGRERLALTLVQQEKHKIDLSLHFMDNDIDAQLGKLDFNFAFMALDTYLLANSSLILSGNRLQNLSINMPTVMILSVDRSSIIGNIIQNHSRQYKQREARFIPPSVFLLVHQFPKIKG